MAVEIKPRSLVKFKDEEVYNLTQEGEDIKYGPLKAFLEATENELFNRVAPEKKHLYLRTRDLVWKGWHAAFITSKEMDPTCLGKVNRVLGKRKLTESARMLSEKTKTYPIYDEDDSDDDSEDDSGDDSEVVPTELQFRDEFAVAVLAYEVVLHSWNWHRFKQIFPKDVYDPLIERIFEAAVKLALYIFDKEDFQRICYRFKIRNEHTYFYEELFDKEPLDDYHNHHNAISRLTLMYSHLWESDVYDALHQVVLGGGMFTKYKPLKIDPTISKMDPCYVSKALELMKKFVPLKAHIKKQLQLELAERKCFHVTDTLVLRAIHSVDLPSIIGDCEDNEEKCSLLSELANDMFVGLKDLILTRECELLFAEECVTAPVMYQFGPCEPEVIDVIKIANHERRLSNARFIGEEHILRALSLSRVRDFVKCMKIEPELCYQGGSTKLYTYELYRLSSYLAKEKDGLSKWGLEHLVFSFLFGSSKENLDKCFVQQPELLKNLRRCESQFLVTSWRDIDILMVLMEKRCRYGERYRCKGRDVVNKLHQEVQSGNLQLPSDEELFEK